jgi:general secretion pathway protein F
MGAYQYVAVDTGGKEHRGILEGDTPKQVRQLLRDRQLLPVEVTEVETEERRSRRQFSLFKGISGLDLALLTRQLATLVKAGLPLEEALLAVSEHTEKPRIQSILLGVRAKVLEGQSLAVGLDEFPYAFPPVYRATVTAGEQAGQLDAVLERLADYTESRHGLRQKVSQAMVYPIVLTTIALFIVTLMLVYVVPKVVGVFETTGQKLPIMTRALIALSTGLQQWWPVLLAVIVAGIYAVNRLLKREEVRRRVHWWLLKAPIFGRVTRGLNTARFTRTLSIPRGATHQCVRGREPADALRGRGSRGARARRWCNRSRIGTVEAISAHERAPDLERRSQRRAGQHARACSKPSGSRDGQLACRDAERARTAADRHHGSRGARDRHGNFVADLPNQSARAINAAPRKILFSRLCSRSQRGRGGIANIFGQVYKCADCD